MIRILQILLLILAFCYLNNFAQLREEPRDVTIEWIFGNEPDEIASIPFYQWLADGSLLLFDETKPLSERTFIKLDPKTGSSTKILDMTKAISSLQTLLGKDNTPSVLSWPDALDSFGKYVVYFFDNDLFLLNLIKNEFQRVTKSKVSETAVSFSPNGNLFGFVSENNLYIYDINRNNITQLTKDGSETIINGTFSWVYWEEIYGHRDVGYWWSDDSKTIAFLRTDDSPVSVAYYTDFEPYQPRVIKQRYPKAGESTPEVTLGIISIENMKPVWMDLPKKSYEYIVRVDWTPDNKNVSVQTMNRAQTEINLYFVNGTNGTVKNILKETDEAWLHVYAPFFYEEKPEFLWLSERDGYNRIYRYSLDGKLLNQVTQGEWSLRPFGAFAMYGSGALIGVDEKEDWIYFTANKESSIEQHLYRIQPDGDKFQRLSSEEGFHRVQLSPDGKYYVDNFSSISSMPTLNLYQGNGKLFKSLFSPRSKLLAPYNFQYPTFFSITAEDGFQIPAQISKPKDFDYNKKYPVIIYVYGGPSAPTVNNSWNSNGWAQSIYFDQILLNNGYLVMTFNNRASAAISEKLERLINKQMYGDVELNDLISAVAWLKSQTYVDSDRIGIWGWSGGGTYTLLGLTHTKEFKAGISVAAVTDWHYYDAKWAECVMKRPVDNPEGYEKTSLVNTAANIHGRLFLVHGTYDDNVHIQNSWAFANQLIEKGILFDMMIYPMRQHGISDSPAKIHLYKKMLEFWKENL